LGVSRPPEVAAQLPVGVGWALVMSAGGNVNGQHSHEDRIHATCQRQIYFSQICPKVPGRTDCSSTPHNKPLVVVPRTQHAAPRRTPYCCRMEELPGAANNCPQHVCGAPCLMTSLPRCGPRQPTRSSRAGGPTHWC
jgi:hypothetical protein